VLVVVAADYERAHGCGWAVADGGRPGAPHGGAGLRMTSMPARARAVWCAASGTRRTRAWVLGSGASCSRRQASARGGGQRVLIEGAGVAVTGAPLAPV